VAKDRRQSARRWADAPRTQKSPCARRGIQTPCASRPG
jgi:hypothetical protein